MSLVEKTNLGADTDIPAKTVVLAGERTAVEWERRPHQKTKNIRGRCKG
jgi:hypothetical protein